MTHTLKANDLRITEYRAALREFAEHGADHEGATETAFGRLLADAAKSHGWTLIPKKAMKSKTTNRPIFPDGTLEDIYYLPRGYWEAKDTDDDLPTEIGKKIKKGYPLVNTIFEDTRRAVLYQTARQVGEYDLTKDAAVADLLNTFLMYAEPDIEGFHQAVEEFREKVPQIARGLVEKIARAHQENKKFQEAFAKFFEVCKTTLNPNIRQEAVDEMLVQHLLTERVFRTIFRESDFTRRNAIAAEVEGVIDALVSRTFSREEFQKSLDKFYRAIEKAAEDIDDFQEKQHFLNTVYERFFQGYSVKTADTHGIIYTPQPVVAFMCASVEEVLKTEFGLTLGSEGVTIVDPCTGTGNFVVSLLGRIPKKDLPRVYAKQLFANEVMLLPYYIAALNIEHAYYELTRNYEPFEGLCFVDTLDLVHERQPSLFSERNAERIEKEKFAPINVVIGNPPYNVGQINENDNNKNRKYAEVDGRLKQTYVKDSSATLRAQLYDPYVKFFRWATDRLKGRDGVVCFISNNSFVDQIAFDGMRKHLLQDFTRIYHLHLEGNVRQNPKLSGTQYNVFGIQVGVGITIAVKSAKHKDRRIFFHRIDKNLRRAAKLRWLDEHKSRDGVDWKKLTPDERGNWLPVANGDEFDGLTPIGAKEIKLKPRRTGGTIFKKYCRGVVTNADAYVYDFDRDRLAARAGRLVDDFNTQLDRWLRSGEPQELEEFLRVDEKVHKWIRRTKRVLLRGKHLKFDSADIRRSQYRPFIRQWYFLNPNFSEDIYALPSYFPNDKVESTNRVIVISDIAFRASGFSVLCTNNISDLHLCATSDSHQCFPFYVYDEDGSNRRENVTDWALKQFRGRYKDKKITKWDIFHYVYALLHHPGYRTKFADNLKKSLPRIPFAPDFRAFAKAGKKLAELHVGYEKLKPFPLEFVEMPGVPLSYRVDGKMKLSKDKMELRVNGSLALAGIPPRAFEYRLGNRSALEWVIDQCHVSEDKRSGIVSDPNRNDDEEYIVRLIGQVIEVSLKTVQIVSELPTWEAK